MDVNKAAEAALRWIIGPDFDPDGDAWQGECLRVGRAALGWSTSPDETCEHEWVIARRDVSDSGAACVKCHVARPALPIPATTASEEE